MKHLTNRFFTGILAVLILSGCATGTQIVLLAESAGSGSIAVGSVNNIIGNANVSGCKAISVGGYGMAPEGTAMLVGIPVLVDCPTGTDLLPDGTLAP